MLNLMNSTLLHLLQNDVFPYLLTISLTNPLSENVSKNSLVNPYSMGCIVRLSLQHLKPF